MAYLNYSVPPALSAAVAAIVANTTPDLPTLIEQQTIAAIGIDQYLADIVRGARVLPRG